MPSDEIRNHTRDLRRNGNNIDHAQEGSYYCYPLLSQYSCGTSLNIKLQPVRIHMLFQDNWPVRIKHSYTCCTKGRTARPGKGVWRLRTRKNTWSQADSHSSWCHAGATSLSLHSWGDIRGAKLHHLACSAAISKRDFRDLGTAQQRDPMCLIL